MKKALLFLLILAGILAGIHSFYSYRKYNVILITIDTLRADYLSCYNQAAPKTPYIDKIASEGVLFNRAHTQISITLPAHASMLTSHHPHDLRLFNNGDVFNGKEDMITDVLRKRGYHSAAFVSLGVLKSSFGLGRAFKEYEDNFDKLNGRYYKLASEMNDLALPWLEKNKDGRFFAWIHYSDPHEPYITVDAPPDTEIFANGESVGKYVLAKKEKIAVNFTAKPGENKIELLGLVPRGPKKVQIAESMRFVEPEIFVNPSDGFQLEFGPEFKDVKLSTGADARYFAQHATMKLNNNSGREQSVQLRFAGGVYQQRTDIVRKNYAAEVQYVDKYIGELWGRLEKLGLLKNSIVILTADHGEGLKTHGNLGHVERLYQETIRVPLIVYYPNLGKRAEVATPIVNHLDIMPTVLDLLHVKHKGTMHGLSLKRYISWSPIDWLTSREINRPRTYTATYAPEARVNSFSMVEGNMKLIHTPNKSKWQWEAYDLKQDATERNNLAAKDVKRFTSTEICRLRRTLEDFRHDAEAAHGKRANPKLDTEQQKMLRDLGYIGGYENAPKVKPNTQENPLKDCN